MVQYQPQTKARPYQKSKQKQKALFNGSSDGVPVQQA
jgi:hypothetical protein